MIGPLKTFSIRKRRKPRVFAIGDIHGCHEELRALLTLLPLDPDSLVVFLGDYIDRGPNSRAVIDALIELGQRCRVMCMLGNHELMLREFFEATDPRRVARFIYNGGGSTLASYSNDEGICDVPTSHMAFFEQLKYFHVEGDHVFVHAGLPVNLDEIDLAEHGEEMVWMRRQPGAPERKFSKIVVHGHTPLPDVEINPHRINIDTSCVYGRRLTAMEIQTQELWHVERSTAEIPQFLHDAKDSRRQAFRFTGRVPVVVQHDGKTQLFETINYSEIGLLMVPVKVGINTGLRQGSSVTGAIGSGAGATHFQGVILRVDDGERHAVKIFSRKPIL